MFSSRTPAPQGAGELSRTMDAARGAGAPLVDLTESNPTRCGFSYDVPGMAAALAGAAGARYEPDPHGLPAARAAVAGYYAERGVTVDPGRLILTSGTSEGYAHLFTLLAEHGDEILVPVPGYPLLEVLTGLAGMTLVPYRSVFQERTGWAVDLAGLRAAITRRTRAVVVVSPNNPTGAFLKQAELAAVSGLCREKGLALIVDEVFSDFGAGSDPSRVVTAAGHDGCLTFVLNGLSKIAGLPQMKLAWIAASGPADLRDEALDRLSFITDAFLSVGTPVQHAAAAMIAGRRVVAEEIRARADANHAALRTAAAGGPLEILAREGGWYGIVRLPAGVDEEELTLLLLQEHGVLVHPGYFYDFPEDGSFLVLSLLPREADFREGVTRLAAAVKGGTS